MRMKKILSKSEVMEKEGGGKRERGEREGKKSWRNLIKIVMKNVNKIQIQCRKE